MDKRHRVAANDAHNCAHECGETGNGIKLLKEGIGPRLIKGVEPHFKLPTQIVHR
jgi:hypothetical protein